MTHSKDLKAALQPYFPRWNGARIALLSLFLIALFKVRTVTLTELCLGFDNQAQPESNHKRLKRFFKGFEIDYEHIAHVVVEWMKIPQPWVLSIDRTNWKTGAQWNNFLVLGIVHEGIAFPILWDTLDKKGNSNQAERMALLNRFQQVFPEAEVSFLAGDREFVGQTWTRYLLLKPLLSFRMRIRETDTITRSGVTHAAKVLFAHLQPGQSQMLTGNCTIWGCGVVVEALRLEDGKLLTVIAPVGTAHPIQDYAQRWGIETLFSAFKTRGFCLESTHFQDAERLSKLFALLTLALCWAMQTGKFVAKQTPITIKKHGRKAKSIFRTGLDHIRNLLLNPSADHYQAFRQTFAFLTLTCTLLSM